MLALRGQDLSALQFLAFARRFGPPQPHVIDQFHHPDDPNIATDNVTHHSTALPGGSFDWDCDGSVEEEGFGGGVDSTCYLTLDAESRACWSGWGGTSAPACGVYGSFREGSCPKPCSGLGCVFCSTCASCTVTSRRAACK